MKDKDLDRFFGSEIELAHGLHCGPAMAVRITRTSDARETVLRIAGELMAEDVAELTRERESVEGPLVLELSNLQSADSAGVGALLELASLGGQIRGASPYIELLLKRKASKRSQSTGEATC